MEFKLLSSDNIKIKNISKCLENILNIPEGSIPLSRGMGLKWNVLSKIPPDMENDIATDIVEKLERYEPRVSVKEVTFSYQEDGEVLINIHIEKGDKFNEYE
jgi:phage baseplate assembly protein W